LNDRFDQGRRRDSSLSGPPPRPSDIRTGPEGLIGPYPQVVGMASRGCLYTLEFFLHIMALMFNIPASAAEYCRNVRILKC